MTTRVLAAVGLVSALFLGYGGGVLAQGQSYSSGDPRQHGYEHGYRDGADRGRQDRERDISPSVTDEDLRFGAREYDPSFGNRRDFMRGYRDGYQAGYDDGYNNRRGRYGDVYRPRDRASRSGSSADASFDNGYRRGVEAGRRDLQQKTRSDYRRSRDYQSGDPTFRDGFERGYQDGYGRSRYQEDGGGYFPSRSNTGPADTRDGVGTPSRTFTIPANQQWTPTNIRVTQGDRLQFQSSGQIQLRPNDPKDVANVAGSLIQRYAPNAPIPNALAGALIGRIDSGRPFGIGNQTTIVAPATGLLYLGINDDVVSDNSGQFQVTISW